jgi:hypothetical protein
MAGGQQRQPYRWAGDLALGVQHALDDDRIGLGEQGRRQRDKAMAGFPGPREIPGSPGSDEPGELAGAQVGRGEDAAGRAQREERRREHVFTGQYREVRRKAGQQRDGVVVDTAHGVLDPRDAGNASQFPQRAQAQGNAGAIRDVVHDQRHRAVSGQASEMGDYAVL